MGNEAGFADHLLSMHDWRSRQPAWQGADGLPMARGEFTLRWQAGEWWLNGPGKLRAVGGDLTHARKEMDAAHIARVSALPAPAVRSVYFIGTEAKVGRAVKIGVADQPERRLRQLQIGSAAPLHILAVTPGGEFEEGIYHAKFARLRLRGEWFRISAALLREITRLRSKAA
jgi:hypothetical protein